MKVRYLEQEVKSIIAKILEDRASEIEATVAGDENAEILSIRSFDSLPDHLLDGGATNGFSLFPDDELSEPELFIRESKELGRDNSSALSVVEVSSDSVVEGSALIHTVILERSSINDETISFNLSGSDGADGATEGSDFNGTPAL